MFLERRDEIATLLRFPVSVEWRRGGEPCEPGGRRDGADAVVVRATLEREDDEPVALAIDRQLLQDTLGLLPDEIAALELRWRGRAEPGQMVADLLRALGCETGGDAFDDVVQAVRRRLPRGVAVYPTGIIQDGKATSIPSLCAAARRGRRRSRCWR